MKVDLQKVLEMLINEEQDQATGLLHQWFVEQSKAVHESIMQEDDGVLEGDDQTQDIEDDQDAIKSEEYYSEAEGDDEEAEAADVEADADAEADAVDVDLDAGLDGAEVEDGADVQDQIEDLQADLARLKAEFNALMGVEEKEHDADIDGDGEIAGADVDAEEEEAEVAEEGLTLEAEEVEESEEAVLEDDDFADLEESFKLEPVADPNLSGGKEIGKAGAAVSVNDTSPIPQKKGEARVGGAAVEIKAKEHKGYAREAAPEVKKSPLLKNQVKNAKADLEGVSKEGDKSAVLNKKDGFGSDSPKSPIGAGATDLRGSDLKRK